MARDISVPGSAVLELVSGVIQLHPEDAMVEAMLTGFANQQLARNLQAQPIRSRERLIRAFQAFVNEYPWNWTPGHVDEWSASMTSERHLAPTTIRNYQASLRLFTEYLTDARYGWPTVCEKEFGTFPVAICHEWNTVRHLQDYEGQPEARPFSREELQRFFDYADDRVDQAVRTGRKGALAAYRDATIFKTIYGWGLRRTEASHLELVDFGRNAEAPQFGSYGMLNVRYGKAKKGQKPRRRNVHSLMGWAVEAMVDYVENARPRFGFPDHPALWLTERGGRIKPDSINDRFIAYRDALKLPAELVPHSLRHSYVTHLTENGVDRRFIQQQVGHERDSSTAIYTHVSDDFMNNALHRALGPAFAGQRG